MVEPASLAILAKLVAAPTSKVAVGTLQKVTVRRRVASAVSKRAKKELSLVVTKKSLRIWLNRGDVQQQLKTDDPATLESAIADLVRLMPGNGPARAYAAEKVLIIIFAELLRAENPKNAIVLEHDLQKRHTTAENQETRDFIATNQAELLSNLGRSRTFPEQIRSLHPWRAAEAATIEQTWPTIATAVASVVAVSNRGDLLKQWAEATQPPWYADAPDSVCLWLAMLAGDYSQSAAALKFYQDAIDRGAFPINRWHAYMAIAAVESDPDMSQHLCTLDEDQHPIQEAMIASTRSSLETSIAIMEAWSTNNVQDETLRLQLLAQFLDGADRLDEAITYARQGAEILEASGPAILSARLLLRRAYSGRTTDKMADGRKALSLALRARDTRRSWLGDSVEPSLMAVNAYMRTDDGDKALAVLLPPPDGDATDIEVSDPRIRRQGATLLAFHDKFDLAKQWASLAGSQFVTAEVNAFEQEHLGNTTKAAAIWAEAFIVAEDDRERVQAAKGIASLGGSLPNLDALAAIDPEGVDEIRLVHSAMTVTGDNLELLRDGSTKSPLLMDKLVRRYLADNEPMLAADILRQSAERWDSPAFMLRSGRCYLEADQPDLAMDAANSALVIGGPDWPGESDAHRLLLRIRIDRRQWNLASEQARRLVTLNSESPGPRWSLAYVLWHRGDGLDAWGALQIGGKAIDPSTPDEAILWVNLAARFDTRPGLIRRALAVMERWPDDEELGGQILVALHLSFRRNKVEAAQGEVIELQSATAAYTSRFPDSAGFQVMHISDDDPLATLIPLLQRRHEQMRHLRPILESGTIPLALAAQLVNKRYAEAAVTTMLGSVRSHSSTEDASWDSVAESMNKAIVIDTTAAATLSLFDPALRRSLLGAFGQVRTTDWAYTDAVSTVESLGLGSTATMGWDEASDRPTFTTITEEQLDALVVRAKDVLAVLSQAARSPWPDLVVLTDLPAEQTYLTSLDMAAERGLPFWTDDVVMRWLSDRYGVTNFGTVDLLRYLARAGQLDAQLERATEAFLVRNRFVDLGRSESLLVYAAELDGWRAGGAAFALSRTPAWSNPAWAVSFVLEAASRSAMASLEDLEGWIAAGALGLVRITVEAAQAAHNLQIFLQRVVFGGWLRSDQLPVVLRAIRSAASQCDGAVSDPLEPVLSLYYRRLLQQGTHLTATAALTQLMEFASDDDKYLANGVVLTN